MPGCGFACVAAADHVRQRLEDTVKNKTETARNVGVGRLCNRVGKQRGEQEDGTKRKRKQKEHKNNLISLSRKVVSGEASLPVAHTTASSSPNKTSQPPNHPTKPPTTQPINHQPGVATLPRRTGLLTKFYVLANSTVRTELPFLAGCDQRHS